MTIHEIRCQADVDGARCTRTFQTIDQPVETTAQSFGWVILDSTYLCPDHDPIGARRLLDAVYADYGRHHRDSRDGTARFWLRDADFVDSYQGFPFPIARRGAHRQTEDSLLDVHSLAEILRGAA